jgi:Protein of unknown function (DUF2846)
MKPAAVVSALLMLAGVASAQNPDPSKWMCRNLADSGGFFYQGETVFGSQACRPILQTPATAQPQAATSKTSPTPQTNATQASQGTATVVIYRPRRFIDASRKGNIYIDGRPLCVLANNTSFRFEVPAGNHSLVALFNSARRGETELPSSQYTFVAGQAYYFALSSHWLIFAVPAQQGEAESKRTKPIKAGSIATQPTGNELK